MLQHNRKKKQNDFLKKEKSNSNSKKDQVSCVRFILVFRRILYIYIENTIVQRSTFKQIFEARLICNVACFILCNNGVRNRSCLITFVVSIYLVRHFLLLFGGHCVVWWESFNILMTTQLGNVYRMYVVVQQVGDVFLAQCFDILDRLLVDVPRIFRASFIILPRRFLPIGRL